MFHLQNTDIEIYNLIIEEKYRQKRGFELVASENFTSNSVMECLGSILTNKYSEGYPDKRYYGGNEIIDKIENICINRALSCMKLSKDKWGVNVQPYSGSPANFAVYTALLKPHDRIMGLDLPSGGHLTHGFYTTDKDGKRKPVSATSIYFESFPYKINETGYIDYDELEKTACNYRPNLLICGGSAYSREWEYKKFRDIADKIGAILMVDMAHISGLVAVQEADNPFEYADIVTTTTHKSLRGPRSGMIYYKKQFETKINSAIFPGLQGGPHENQIAAVATQLKEVMTPQFKNYIIQVKKNAKHLAKCLMEYNYNLVSNGTDNHLILWDLRETGISGNKMEKLCDMCDITVNKNTIYGDLSAFNPGGIRIGTCALTSRSMLEEDFTKVANILHEIVNLAIIIQEKSGKKLVDFLEETKLYNEQIMKIKNNVNTIALNFDLPGI
jgi:glycine hydroxymethyltransferase